MVLEPAKRRNLGLILGSLILILLIPVPLHAKTADRLEVGKFSSADINKGLPDGWKPLTFKKIKTHTDYRLVMDKGIVVVKASSSASASGLVRKIQIDPALYPIITWRWKVANIYKKSDVTQKEGDDYPARLYITFEYDSTRHSLLERAVYKTTRVFFGEYPPTGAVNYIWASKAAIGAIVPNPFTDRARMIVLQSGAAQLNKWINEERNIYKDYKKAFGSEPPMISGVALMTDSDNTGESATAFYGDIIFRKK